MVWNEAKDLLSTRRHSNIPRRTRMSRRPPMALIDLANPSRFLALSGRILPWLAGATLVAFAFGLSQVYVAPDDYQRGATVKNIFIHVLSAWPSIVFASAM